MDEKVIANLVFFLIPSPALTILSPLALLTTFPSLALIIPFPVNKLPNKLAPKVPKSILKSPLLFSLISFSIALLTPFHKISEFSSSLIILIIFNNLLQ